MMETRYEQRGYRSQFINKLPQVTGVLRTTYSLKSALCMIYLCKQNNHKSLFDIILAEADQPLILVFILSADQIMMRLGVDLKTLALDDCFIHPLRRFQSTQPL